ncbi:alpha-L-arabinofuranosidase C-terminal domain-containing protein [Micromonospora sicca]|uniref:alpha-L-arabinofuranosidase C-terminal domain-containing protein n=1 Tax=Micromonospora sicca TaxID=2202420 RepID=UPI001374A889|nr:alpha-L-arabinofuranosidase C-terminal domain-containing protein [Micromonospora sp. 4G51]
MDVVVPPDPDPAPPDGADENAAARKAWRDSAAAGEPLTGKALGDRFKRSEWWGRNRIKEARRELQAEQETGDDVAGETDQQDARVPVGAGVELEEERRRRASSRGGPLTRVNVNTAGHNLPMWIICTRGAAAGRRVDVFTSADMLTLTCAQVNAHLACELFPQRRRAREKGTVPTRCAAPGRRRRCSCRIADSAATAADAAATDPQTLTVDTLSPAHAVSPTLYGLFFEEINHAGVGGMYAELIRNRAFMESATAPAWWAIVQDRGGSATASLDGEQALNAVLTRSLRLRVNSVESGQRVGIANGGYFGLPVVPGRTYQASFFAKASNGFTGPLTVSIEDAGGRRVHSTARVSGLTSTWQRFTATLRVPPGGKPSTNNRFVIGIDQQGGKPSEVAPGTSVWLQVVSLFPPTYNDEPNGLRPDMVEKLKALNPRFLRFPGGNYVQGLYDPSDPWGTRFDWKKSIGPIWTRPGHYNASWSYWSDDGLGLYEYLRLAEDLDATPVIGVFAGFSIDRQRIGNGREIVPEADLGPYVEDALDLIEYVIGPVTSPWRARRAADGHPEPFATPLIEIGNEDNARGGSSSYNAYRYARFHDAIKAAYPQITTIATTAVTSRPMEVLDEHLYSSPTSLAVQAHRYDTYDRNGPNIFVGEYAARRGNSQDISTGPLGYSLGEAAFMTGLERNSDIVTMASYAPLFSFVGQTQWGFNMIGFDPLTSYGGASYYVQQMFARNVGDQVLPVTSDGTGLFCSSTIQTATGEVHTKIVNTGNSPQSVRLDFAGSRASTARVQVLSDPGPEASNTLADPTRVIPRIVDLRGSDGQFSYQVPANSLSVVTIRR